MSGTENLLRAFGAAFPWSGYHAWDERLNLIVLPLIRKPVSFQKETGRWYKVYRNISFFLFDILLFCVAAMGLLILCYHVNSGRFRLSTILLFGFGVWFYQKTIGQVINRLIGSIIWGIRAVLTVTIYVIGRPFVIFARILLIFFEKIYIFFIFSLANMRKILYNKYRKKKILRSAECGFVENKEIF